MSDKSAALLWGILVLLGVLVLIGMATVRPGLAQGDIRYVAATGSDNGNNCGAAASPCATIQHALDVAVSGDRVWVAGGTYSRTGTVAAIPAGMAVAVIGGFDPTFTVSDTAQYPTVLDAQQAGAVISVTAASQVTLTNLTLTGGNATGNCGNAGCGGGIHAEAATLDVENCIVRGNVASTGGWGYGGGIYAWQSHLEVRGSTIAANTASADPQNQAGFGGGLYLAGGTLVLAESDILFNTGHITYSGAGGAIMMQGVTSAQVLSSTIRGNLATRGTYNSQGGALRLDQCSGVHIAGNRIAGNRVSSHPTQGAGYGGGFYLWDSSVSLERNVIEGNDTGTWTAAWRPGGGLYIVGQGAITLTNNLIVHNTGGDCGDGLYAGIDSPPAGTVLLVNNTIAGNGYSGVAVHSYANLELQNNLIAGHAVGLSNCYVFTGTVSADTNLFWNASDPITGSNAIRQDPRLTAGYHPGIGSPAVDSGLTIPWLTVDLEGVPRPQGSGYDIGAFEGAQPWRIFLPVVLRHAP